jgi:ankyrin repeat protein
MAKLFLAYGADVNMVTAFADYRAPALWWATRRGSSLTKLLVDDGADVSIASAHGTALSLACELGHQWIVEFLLERGARPDDMGVLMYTPLTRASKQGHKDVVKLLIAAGADVSRPGDPSRANLTPLRAAAEYDRTDVVETLIDAGADLDAEDDAALSTALEHGHEHTVTLLEARGAKKLTSEQLSRDFNRCPRESW